MLNIKTWTLLSLLTLLSTPAFAIQSGFRSVPGNYSVPSPYRAQQTWTQRPVQRVLPATTCSRQTVYRSAAPIQVQSIQAQPVQTFTSSAAPTTTVIDPAFRASTPNSPYRVDHSSWDQFLSRNLINDAQGVSRVYYGQVSNQDRQLLGGYLQQLQGTNVQSLNRNEQFAFWVNLYNARTVALVLDNYPINSIQQINNGQAFDTPNAVNVLGRGLSLNEIESGIIRPVWNDPRIHYALNCGAYGCPNLARTAYTGQNLNTRLNTAAQQFINTDRAVQRTSTGLQVSKIYDWYKDDFGGTDQGVISHIRQYANPTTLAKINGVNTIENYYYDWQLNDASGYGGQITAGQPVPGAYVW